MKTKTKTKQNKAKQKQNTNLYKKNKKNKKRQKQTNKQKQKTQQDKYDKNNYTTFIKRLCFKSITTQHFEVLFCQQIVALKPLHMFSYHKNKLFWS